MRLGLRALEQTITVDPIVVDGQVVGSADALTGNAPPAAKRRWWPWLLAGGALVVGWYLIEKSEEGRKDRPLVGA